MTNDEQHTHGVPATTMTALVLAVFTVSVGYGAVLPLLPDLVERLLAADGVAPSQVARHTGLLTGAYALALFVGAPAWGRLSDSYGAGICSSSACSVLERPCWPSRSPRA